MKILIDTEKQVLTLDQQKEIPLYSKEAFNILSEQWVKVGWNQKYQYTFSWMDRPIIQLPEDMIRSQEVIYRVKPDVIIETGIAHGGSLIYYASLCKANGKGHIVGVDIDIRAHNRKAIEEHEMFPLITLIEGSSTDDKIVNQVQSFVKPDETALVFLDSNHTYQHVLDELNAYAQFVTSGSYIVATDGVMETLHDVPRAGKNWIKDNPKQAAIDFVASNPDFIIEQPSWPFNESDLNENITHWPSAWIRRK